MGPEKLNQNQINRAVLQQLENASRVVKKQPSWMRGILATSSLATNSTPRTTEASDTTNSNTQRD